ncbi:MAG TPA: DciA family protein [Vicinamibacterales bacterium]|jgi:hypothetical protein
MPARRPGTPAIVPAGSDPFVPLQAVVPSALGALLCQSPYSEGKLAFAWRVAVGPGMDRASQVRLGADGRLHVTATDARWQREIRRSVAIILPRLQALLGAEAVRAIEVRTRPD